MQIKYIATHKTGSRYICDPPPMDTDDDTLFLVDAKDLLDINCDLMLAGWEIGGSIAPGDIWYSYKKGVDNYLITTSDSHYAKWITATRLAKAFNLLNKQDRIALFEVVVDGKLDSIPIEYACKL